MSPPATRRRKVAAPRAPIAKAATRARRAAKARAFPRGKPPTGGVGPDGRLRLPTHSDARGFLTFVEGERHVPFPIKRIFTIYGVAPGYERGHHAHYECRQVLVAVSGAVTVVLDDGATVKTIRLSDPGEGLLVEPMVWHTLENFAPGTVCLVLASLEYHESDYIRDLAEFRRLVGGGAP